MAIISVEDNDNNTWKGNVQQKLCKCVVMRWSNSEV